MPTYIPLDNYPIQYQNSSGDNDSGGVISFFLSGTSTPANLYSDSIGTAIGTSITLNSLGMPESGGNVINLYRDVDIAYKLVYTPVTGSPITIDPIPKLSDVISQALIAGALYPNNTAEASLGTTIDARNIPWFVGGRYGLSVSASASDNEGNLLDLVEVAVTSERNEVVIDEGRFSINSTDLTTISAYKGQLTIKGAGRPNRKDIPTSTDYGTMLDFQNTVGNSLIINDGDTNITQVHLKDLGILGKTTGHVIHMDYCPRARMTDVLIHNNAAGIAWYMRNVWTGKFDYLQIIGNSSAQVGEGLVFETNASASSAGGMNYWNEMTVTDFDVPARLGQAYDATFKVASQLYFDSCQFREADGGVNKIGLWLRHGVRGVYLNGCWFEENEGANIRVTDSADRILLQNSLLVGPVSGAGVDVELGSTGGDVNTDSIGYVEITGNNFSLANRPVIRRYCTATNTNKKLYIEANRFSDNGGDPVVLDDTIAVDTNIVIGQLNDFGTRGPGQIVRDSSDTNDMSWYARYEGTQFSQSISTSLDLSLQTEIPTIIRVVATISDVPIILPITVPIGKACLIVADATSVGSAFAVVLDPGSTSQINDNPLATTVELKSDYDACILIGRTATRWNLLRFSRGKGAHIADIGAAPTQLQFNTLLGELRAAGALDEY